MKTIEWFFDFVSPFSYLQCEKLPDLPQTVRVEYRPILFGALLSHWDHKGPAEIPRKRTFTYRSLVWSAHKQNIPFRFPRAHPFNPLPLLRLSIALDNRPEAVREIFRFVWRDGKLPQDAEDWSTLTRRLNTADADDLIQSDSVKKILRGNTNRAIEQGIFGVPTMLVDEELFWGVDYFEFLLEYLQNPNLLEDDEIRRVSNLPAAIQRKK